MDLGIQQQQARAADETDRPWGEAVKAVVEPNAGFKIDPAEIITFCRETLGGVKTPETVEVGFAAQRQRQGSVAPNSGSIGWGVGERSDSNRLRPLQGQSSDAPQSPGEFEALRQPRCRPEP